MKWYNDDMGVHIPFSYVNHEWAQKVKNSKDLTKEQKEALLKHAQSEARTNNIAAAFCVLVLFICVAFQSFVPAVVALIIVAIFYFISKEALDHEIEELKKKAETNQKRLKEINDSENFKVGKKCTKCGNQILFDAKFCPKCGGPVKAVVFYVPEKCKDNFNAVYEQSLKSKLSSISSKIKDNEESAIAGAENDEEDGDIDDIDIV